MQKLVSENLFVAFLKKNKWAFFLILLVLLGALLIILSNNASETSAPDSDEARIAAVVSGIEGAGRVEVVVNKKEGEVISCAVICSGGSSERVVSEVKSLISSLYGIGYNRISVLKLSE